MSKRQYRFIGDTHSNYNIYKNLVETSKTKTIHVGDLGLCFEKNLSDISFLNNKKDFFVHGNHDNPDVCAKNSCFLGRYGYNESLDIFYVSGAHSIDNLDRTPGLDLFANEQLSMKEMADCINLYVKIKPKTVVSHTCPERVKIEVLKGKTFILPTSTEFLLDSMYSLHSPKTWVFGHFHADMDMVHDFCRFVCVNLNSAKDINV